MRKIGTMEDEKDKGYILNYILILCRGHQILCTNLTWGNV